MEHYTCPTCGKELKRDMALFYKHTDQHIVDAIKKNNPDWVNENGYCEKCLDYFKGAMSHIKQGKDVPLVNIGVAGTKKRLIAGGLASVAAFIYFIASDFTEVFSYRSLVLFILIQASLLCFIQAGKKVCVLYGLKGTKDMDDGEKKLMDEAAAKALFKASLQIIAGTTLISLILTFVLTHIV